MYEYGCTNILWILRVESAQYYNTIPVILSVWSQKYQTVQTSKYIPHNFDIFNMFFLNKSKFNQPCVKLSTISLIVCG